VKICFPVIHDEGINGTIYGHFASTPLFSIIDTETGASSIVKNCDSSNPDAGCNPFIALKGRQLDGIVAGGIGDDTLRAMNLCGFSVFEAQSASIAENLELFKNNTLPQATIMNSRGEGRCGDEDGVSHGCNHDHDHDHEEECDHDCTACTLDCGER
jgi:predicted Fe-Mo cluster-binding NifX family protein